MGSSDTPRHAIGLDVGGTKIAAGLVDLETGALLERHTVPTRPERGGPAVLADATSVAQELAAAAAQRALPLAGVGVGICELVDLEGNVTSSATVAWAGLPVRERLADVAPGGRVVVEADVRAHAIAEARFGAGRRLRHFVFVSVGTGISSCLVLDGRPHAGAHGNALVLASSPYTLTCTACGTVLRPVLEEEASGLALVTRYNRLGERRVTRGEQVVAAAGHDALAHAIVRSAGAALGVSVGWLINVLDPEAVIVGGGLGMAGGLYWRSMVESAREHVWAEAGRSTPIIPAEVGADAGIVGAAATVG